MRGSDYQMGTSTICIHGGNKPYDSTGAIKTPLYMNNIYELPTNGTDPNWSGIDGYIYVRNGSSNQYYLEEKLAALEGAESCAVLGSGVSALAGTFFTFLSTGDHVICSRVCYAAVNKLFTLYLPAKINIEVSFVDTIDLAAVKSAIKPNTKMIHVETPGNPTTGISDIAAIAELARKYNIIFTVDGTFASPILQKPLELGADLVIHSATKYINGHGDSLCGAILGNRELISKIKTEAMVNLGGVISPFNAWLVARGMVTLPLRMKQHSKNAMEVAKFLENNQAISFVAYPGLKSHPQHELAKKQMKDFSGMICFGLKADEVTCYKFLAELRMIIHAVSLGDAESLIVYTSSSSDTMKYYPKEFQGGFYRLSVGLEDATDIIADLSTALNNCSL